MPILCSRLRKEYAIAITDKCNWTCPYCAVKNNYDFKNSITPDKIFDAIKKIEYNSDVTLMGGEPGLVQRNLIEQYIKLLKIKKCKLYLETNGTFILKYPDLLSTFTEILYHCSQDLDLCQSIIKTSTKNIRYLIIIHDKNINKLYSFLSVNRDIQKFDIIEATYPYQEMNGPTLSKQNKKYVLLKFGNRMTKESFIRFIHGKDFNKIFFFI